MEEHGTPQGARAEETPTQRTLRLLREARQIWEQFHGDGEGGFTEEPQLHELCMLVQIHVTGGFADKMKGALGELSGVTKEARLSTGMEAGEGSAKVSIRRNVIEYRLPENREMLDFAEKATGVFAQRLGIDEKTTDGFLNWVAMTDEGQKFLMYLNVVSAGAMAHRKTGYPPSE